MDGYPESISIKIRHDGVIQSLDILAEDSGHSVDELAESILWEAIMRLDSPCKDDPVLQDAIRKREELLPTCTPSNGRKSLA